MCGNRERERVRVWGSFIRGNFDLSASFLKCDSGNSHFGSGNSSSHI